MKKFALLIAFVAAPAFAMNGPVRLTPKEVKANAIQTKLSSTMHTNPTQVEISIKGTRWTASELSTFNGTPKAGPAIERIFAEGSVRRSAGAYQVSVNPVDR